MPRCQAAIPLFFQKPLEHFPKSVKQFSDKKCDNIKQTERGSDSIKTRYVPSEDTDIMTGRLV